MRASLYALVVLIWPPVASAGLYVDNAAEPGVAIPMEKVLPTVLGLRGAAVEPKGKLDDFSPRAFYLRQAGPLESRRQAGALSPADRANLGGCLVRLGRVKDAISVLRAGLSSGHFQIHANLATAYFLEGDLRQAIQIQELLLSTWPTVWAGWKGERLAWYRECERSFLQLMRLRDAEGRDRRSGPKELDRLFPKVRFLAEDGTYKPGQIARRYADEIPGRAIDTVLQLCVWLPGDLRLFWLLGELFNAAGQVDRAYQVLDTFVAPSRSKLDLSPGQLSWFPNQFKDLEAHHVTLARALPVMQGLREYDLIAYLFCAARSVPLPNLAPGAAGPVAHVAGAWALVVELPTLKQQRKEQEQAPKNLFPFPDQGAPAAEPAPLAFTWRHLGVSFGFGALATLLVGMQWREWQRRRGRRFATYPPPAQGVGAGTDRVAGPPVPPGPS